MGPCMLYRQQQRWCGTNERRFQIVFVGRNYVFVPHPLYIAVSQIGKHATTHGTAVRTQIGPCARHITGAPCDVIHVVEKFITEPLTVSHWRAVRCFLHQEVLRPGGEVLKIERHVVLQQLVCFGAMPYIAAAAGKGRQQSTSGGRR